MGLMDYNPADRWTATRALKDDYFLRRLNKPIVGVSINSNSTRLLWDVISHCELQKVLNEELLEEVKQLRCCDPLDASLPQTLFDIIKACNREPHEDLTSAGYV